MQYARGNTSGQNIDGKRLQDILHSTPNADEQQKVKIAFAEGLNCDSLRNSFIKKTFR